MKFVEKFDLKCRGAVEQEGPREVDGSLLIGERAIGQWEDHGRAASYGHDDVAIFPAVYNGEKVFVVVKDWRPAKGYSAFGVDESIVSLDAGIKLMIEHGIYNGHFQDK